MEQNISLPFPLKEAERAIKVIVVDDQALFIDGLKMMLSGYPTIEIIGEALDGTQAMDLVVKEKPDVILTDIQMPEMDGVELTRALQKYYPEIKILALTGFNEDHYIVDMLEAGARGYLTKNTRKEKVVEAIYSVMGGGLYFSETSEMKLIRKIAESQMRADLKDSASMLTPKEKEVVKLICEELSSKEIAGRLGVRAKSVEGYRYKIYEKLGVRNAVGLAFFAIRSGLFKL